LMASFMSGMAGNVTAFNTVWTYDIYQTHIRKGAPDSHYLWMGRMATIGGTLLSIGAAYVANLYNNIMDLLQLVFGFVNAPLFATMILGMFWKGTTSAGAFVGLLSGTGAALVTLMFTEAEGKGGWLGVMHHFGSALVQSFWVAIVAFITAFVVTVVVSLVTKPKPISELKNLVWAATEMPATSHEPWYKRPVVLAVAVAVVCIAFNILFW